MSTTPQPRGTGLPGGTRRGGTLDGRARQGGAPITGVTTQHRIPLGAFARWLHTATVVLPVPLNSTYAATYPVGDELVELTTERIGGSATPGARAGLDAAQERVLEACRSVLVDPQTVVFAIRTAGGVSHTTAGIVRDRTAVLLQDGPEDVVVRILPSVEVVDAVARTLPALRGAPMQPMTVPIAALTVLAEEESMTTPAAQRALHVAGIRADDVASVFRVQGDLRAHGMLGALRSGEPATDDAVLADWYESPAGSVLKRRLDDTLMQFAPATRESLTALLATAARAASAPRG